MIPNTFIAEVVKSAIYVEGNFLEEINSKKYSFPGSVCNIEDLTFGKLSWKI